MEPYVDVLAVDDEERNLRLIEAALAPLGCRVRTAANGKEALAAVRAVAPDVVLLDVIMPGMDGYQVCRALKSDEETRLIPVLLVSALTDHPDRVRGIEAGCDDFITKPFDMVELRARVRTLARLSYAGLRRREAELLACAVEDLTDGLVITGEEGEVLLANGRARELVWRCPTPAAGQTFMTVLTLGFDLHPPLTWDDLREAESYTFSAVRSETDDAPLLWLQIAVRRVQPRRASISTRFAITLRDITREVTDGRVRVPYLNLVKHSPCLPRQHRSAG